MRLSSAPSPLPEAGLDPAVETLLEDAGRRPAGGLDRREWIAELVAGGAFVAVSAALVVLLPASRGWSPGVVVALVLGLAAAARVEFDVGAGFTIPTELVFIPMLFLAPLAWVPALVAGALVLSRLPDYLSGRVHPGRAILALGDAWYAVGPVLVLSLAGAHVPTWSDWPIYLGALAFQVGADLSASMLRAWMALGIPPRLQASEMAWVYLVDALLAPIGLLAAFASVGHPYAFLAGLPLCALLGLFALERRLRMRQALALSHAYRGTAMLLGDLVEDDDQYTGEHSRTVLELALSVGEALRLGGRDLRDLEFAALLHDVGKVNIPNDLINKAGPLTHEEMALMRTHTIEGHRILTRFGGVLGGVGSIVRACHERWDGAGYPDGLAGNRIPLPARIIFCCDAFNAMTTDRSYRAARPLADALTELRAHAGTQFDPRVVEVLARLVEARPARLPGEDPVAAELLAGLGEGEVGRGQDHL
jgi:HD-GYP domain-containing protein (c-di-GMP phosphodiesterase class II)